MFRASLVLFLLPFVSLASFSADEEVVFSVLMRGTAEANMQTPLFSVSYASNRTSQTLDFMLCTPGSETMEGCLQLPEAQNVSMKTLQSLRSSIGGKKVYEDNLYGGSLLSLWCTVNLYALASNLHLMIPEEEMDFLTNPKVVYPLVLVKTAILVTMASPHGFGKVLKEWRLPSVDRALHQALFLGSFVAANLFFAPRIRPLLNDPSNFLSGMMNVATQMFLSLSSASLGRSLPWNPGFSNKQEAAYAEEIIAKLDDAIASLD